MSVPVDIRPVDLVRVWAVLDDALPTGAEVYVFGSRARGTGKRGSDLDLAVDAGRALTRDEAGRIADGFEESDLPYTVDVLDLQAASETFKAVIARDRVDLPRP